MLNEGGCARSSSHSAYKQSSFSSEGERTIDMDHRFNRGTSGWTAPVALAVCMLLAAVLQAPLWAQSDDRSAPAELETAVVPPPHHHVASKRVVSGDDRNGADMKTNGADAKTNSANDPESQPLPSLQKSQPDEPVEDTGSLALNVLGKLGLVVALIIAGAAVWKRWRGEPPLFGGRQGAANGSAPALQVASTVALGPQRFLHLVTVGRHQLLVGSSAQSVSLIAVLEGGEAGAAIGPGATAAAMRADGSALELQTAAEPRPAPADRFEDLVLRMRELETGACAGNSVRGPAGAEPRAETGDRSAATPGGREAIRDALGSRSGRGMSSEPRFMREAGPAGNTLLEHARVENGEDEERRSARGAMPGVSGGHAAAVHEGADQALAPGTLFRTSRAAARGGADA
jgi:flagellar biogenesis protein FliO